MGKESIYGLELQNFVKDVYGPSSSIYLKMCKGEFISGLVKLSIKKKGKAFRIKDKKEIFNLCKEQEQKIGAVSIVEM